MKLYEIDGVDSALVESVCSILKKKWMINDHVVDLEKLCRHFRITTEVAKKIVSWYETQLISTKFEIV